MGVDTALIGRSAGFFGVRSPVRSALTNSARQAHPNTRLLIIGDTPFDGIAAKAACIPFLADCTGKYDRSAFEDSDAVAVIDARADSYKTVLAAVQGEAVGRLRLLKTKKSKKINFNA